MLVLLVVLVVRRRQSDHAFTQALDERGERLALALWATGERYWDYHLPSGALRRLISVQRGDDGGLIEDTLQATALIHPDDLGAARQALAACLDDAASRYHAVLRVSDGDAGWCWVRVRGRVIERDRAGAVVRIAGTALNVNATREAERERQIAAEVLRSMSEAVAVVDAEFRFVSVNPAFLRMTGYAESDVIGRTADMLDSDQHDTALQAQIRLQAADEGRWSGELWQRRKDGDEFLAAVELRTVHDAELDTRLHVAVLNDITQHKRTEQELRYLANFDTLTSLPNRALLSERLSRAIIRAHRQDRRVAVLFLDLDRFKDVNDSLGHAAGDRILRAAAVRLQQTVGAQHTVARLGGDEFTVIIEDLAHAHDAERVAREIINAFEAPLMLDDRREITISPSIGISLYPDHAQVPTALLKHADTAMYQAKAAGRRTFMRYDDNMDVAVRQRATLSGALRKVLDRGELRLVFQPRLSLPASRITGVEALLRWYSPEHGDIPPNDFIPLAEECGLMGAMGRWALDQACRQLVQWRREGLEVPAVAVNLSASNFHNLQLPAIVAQTLVCHGLQASDLVVELTESILLDSNATTLQTIDRLHAQGVRLSMDDFGTGYSSLSYLRRLPITELKLDQSFVADLENEPTARALSEAILGIGTSLGLTAVAEGVDTEAQKNILQEQGYAVVQGYFFARPMAPEQLAGWLDSRS